MMHGQPSIKISIGSLQVATYKVVVFPDAAMYFEILVILAVILHSIFIEKL